MKHEQHVVPLKGKSATATDELLQEVRRAVFGEPLLAHPAELAGVNATWHPHPTDEAARDQDDTDADTDDDEEHMLSPQSGSV
jgi:hypothetical protein